MDTPKLTLWQRFKSETPPFWRKAQVIGAGIATAGTALTQVPLIPAIVSTVLITTGTVIATVAQFTVTSVLA